MRRFTGVLLMLAGCLASAGETLPEVVARCGTMEVRREQARRLLQQTQEPETAAQTDFRILLRKRLTEHFCTELLKAMLEREGFPLSAGQTEADLKALYAGYPAGFPKPSDGDIHRVAGEPFTQLQWSFRRYLLNRRPEFLQVPEPVVERYYREHQQQYLRPRSFSVTAYRAADAARLLLLRARMQQGMPPDKIQKEFADVTETVLIRPAAPEENGLKAGDWQAPERTGELWQVCRIQAEHPAEYVPLDRAAPMIRETLIRKSAARALELKLNALLEQSKMEFYF